MLNILFFLEPSLEHRHNPLFRYKTLRNSLNPQLLSLKLMGHNTSLLASDVVIKAAKDSNEHVDSDSIIPVEMIEWTNCKEEYKRLSTLQDSNKDFLEENKFYKLILKSLNGFVPDIIISWESEIEYFKSVYPEAKVLYCHPGVFSRPPYPNFITFNTKLLSNSELSEESLPTLSVSLDRYRDYLRPILSLTSPISRSMKIIKSQFNKVILFPLQVDGYFTVDNVISGYANNQFDLLVKILESTPDDIGVLVTSYKSLDTSSGVLNQSNIAFLESKFSNFIYISDYELIPNVSQFIVPEVDGAIVISSALAYQAALWEKPLLTIGESHVSNLCTNLNLESFIQDLGKEFNRDVKIVKLIKETNLLDSEIKDPEFFENFIKSFSQTGIINKDRGEIDINGYLVKNSRIDALMKGFNKSDISSLFQVEDHTKELSVQIKKHEIISFDIFDTLLCRPFKKPSDLFDFMQKKVMEIVGENKFSYKLLRQQAEKIAFETSIERGEGETTLAEIYGWFTELSGIRVELAEKIMALEMDYELELIRSRSSGYLAYCEALALNKKIILISDMYLTKDFIETLLSKNGINVYDKLYLSSEYKEKKHSGKLFDFVLNDNQDKSILHVGDNLKADVIKAKEKGIKPFHLPKAFEKFEQSDFYKGVWERDSQRHSNDWNSVLSLIAEKYYGNPYNTHHRRTLFNGNAALLGYSGFGPLLLGYTKWLIETAIVDKVEDLYFLSRDGKVMKSAYDIISSFYKDAPRSHYLLCSRRAVNVAKIDSLEGIYDLLEVDFQKTKLGILLDHRFGLKSSMINEEILLSHGLTLDSTVSHSDQLLLKKLMKDLSKLIFNNSFEERELYNRYLELSGFNSNRVKAIVDIGYAGTMQESLAKLTGQNNIGGYYLMTFRQARTRLKGNGLGSSAYLAEFVDRHDTFHPFCRHVPLYETLFSASDTSFVKFTSSITGDLEAIYIQKLEGESKRVVLINSIQNSALDFIDEFTRIFKYKLKDIDIEPNKSLRTLQKYFHQPSYRDAAILCGIVFEDAYGSGGGKVILPMEDQIDKVNGVWLQGQNVIKDYINAVNKNKVIENNLSLTEFPVIKTNRSIARLKSIENKILKKTAGDRKYNKYLKDRESFFRDSQKPLADFYWKIFGSK